ncbi:hypothetical protein HKX48_000659 [Thoreauomyces humboldtii]|nr:hypothetical protein HKX48_000659 [Thoreauomyces humboldtii]
MSNYERLPVVDDDDNHHIPSLSPDTAPSSSSSHPITASSASSSTASPAAPSASVVVDGSVPTTAAPVRDGVFSNLTAKADPTAAAPQGKAYEELEPPSYAEAAHDRVPTYYETTVIASGYAEDGEVLIEGLPVGETFAFLVNLFVSASFDFIGFLLTAMLATSHAARAGSRMGFGITLIRYGFFMRTTEDEMIQQFDDQYDPNLTSPEEFRQEEQQLKAGNQWLSLIFIFLGFFIMLRAQAEFIRARRMKEVIAATSDVTTTA